MNAEDAAAEEEHVSEAKVALGSRFVPDADADADAESAAMAVDEPSAGAAAAAVGECDGAHVVILRKFASRCCFLSALHTTSCATCEKKKKKRGRGRGIRLTFIHTALPNFVKLVYRSLRCVGGPFAHLPVPDIHP